VESHYYAIEVFTKEGRDRIVVVYKGFIKVFDIEQGEMTKMKELKVNSIGCLRG